MPRSSTTPAQARPEQGQRHRPTARSPACVCSTRRWSPRPTSRLQRIRGFYDFPDQLDVDRYPTRTASMRDTVVAVRELTGPPPEPEQLDQPAPRLHPRLRLRGRARQQGRLRGPARLRRQGHAGHRQPWYRTKLKESRIYFGEAPARPSTSIVGGTGATQELDYPESGGTGQKNTTYNGKGGVPVGSFLNRLLYAAKYGEHQPAAVGRRQRELQDPLRPQPARAGRRRSRRS